MPNITDFDAGNLQLRPTETGVESFAQAGRRAGAFYNQAAESKARLGQQIGQDIRILGDTAVNYLDHQQINAGADKLSKFFVNQTENMESTLANADVHDPSVAQKWRDQVFEPAAQQFLDSGFFTTEKSRNWANEKINTMRQHFFVQSEAEMSRIAKVSVDETLGNMVTNYSNAAVANPASVDTSVALLSGKLDDIIKANPNIKGSDAAEIKATYLEKAKRQIIQNGATSAIINGGNPSAAAASWAARYPDYINGAEALQLAKAARVQERANTAYSKQIELANRQLATQNAETIRAQTMDKYTKTDPTTGATTIDPQYYQEAKKLLTTGAPNAASEYENMINWADAMRKFSAGEAKPATDPQVYSQLSALVETGDPRAETEIRKAEASFKLDPKQGTLLINWNKANREIDTNNNPMFKYATEGAKQIIEGTTAGEKATSVGKFPAFMQAFTTEYLKERNAGTLPPNALDMNDDKSLIRQMLAPYDINRNLGSFIKNNGGIGAPPIVPTTPDQMQRAREELGRRLGSPAAPIPRAEM